MQEDYNVGILLDAVVQMYAVCYEIMRSFDRRVVDFLRPEALHRGDLIPEHIVRRHQFKIRAVQYGGDPAQTLPTWGVFPQSAPAKLSPCGGRERPMRHVLLSKHSPDSIPDFSWHCVDVGVAADRG